MEEFLRGLGCLILLPRAKKASSPVWGCRTLIAAFKAPKFIYEIDPWLVPCRIGRAELQKIKGTIFVPDAGGLMLFGDV